MLEHEQERAREETGQRERERKRERESARERWCGCVHLVVARRALTNSKDENEPLCGGGQPCTGLPL